MICENGTGNKRSQVLLLQPSPLSSLQRKARAKTGALLFVCFEETWGMNIRHLKRNFNEALNYFRHVNMCARRNMKIVPALEAHIKLDQYDALFVAKPL